jgi:NAD(P)-dependent dehydrogenase (short-subunit alcohol dehydrogenase family)
LSAFSLTGRTALVTGASSGLGAGFARTLAQAGARVVLGARRVERCSVLANAIGAAAMAVELDVTSEASVIAAFDAAEAQFGTVDSVVCNAGVGTGGRSTDVAAAGLQQVVDTNLVGTYLVAREGARRMIAAGSEGRIVLIGSITALQNMSGDAAYAATKAAITHLGRQFAREWVRLGINVNTIQPGYLLTEANADWYAATRGKAEIQGMHRGRLLDPDALDDMLLYLLSDRSRQVTGGVFTIDDGASL